MTILVGNNKHQIVRFIMRCVYVDTNITQQLTRNCKDILYMIFNV